MILWSSRKLEQALADNALGDWEKAKYIILPAVLGALAGPAYIIRPVYGSRPPVFNSLATVPCALLAAYLTYRGIRRCFHANQNLGGKAFFERFVVIGVPPMIRIMAVVLPLSLAFVVAAAALRERVPFLFERASIIAALLGPILVHVFYSMVRNSFLRLGELIKVEEPENS